MYIISYTTPNGLSVHKIKEAGMTSIVNEFPNSNVEGSVRTWLSGLITGVDEIIVTHIEEK